MNGRSPSIPRRILTGVLLALVLAAVFVAGIAVGGHPRATGIADLPPVLRDRLLGASDDPVTSEVIGILEDEYYVPVDGTALQRASVDALLASLKDRYTFYLDPEEYAALLKHMDGVLDGVGMSIDLSSGRAVVTRLYDGGPAQKGGIRRGDVIVSVNGVTVSKTVTLNDLTGRIRGPAGTTVTLGVRTGDAPVRTLTLTRATVQIPLTDSRVIATGGATVGYVRLSAFEGGAGRQMRAAVRDLTARGATRLILDLRGNPGGLVNEALKVAGTFLPDNSPVVTEQGLHRSRTTLRTDGTPLTSLPMAVLVDRDSASSSEIVSGALRDDRKVPLVGTRTFGKALVQTTRPLRNGGALHYTSARYLTPSGFDLAKRGLAPDVSAPDDPKTPRDETLQAALRLLTR